MTDSIIDDDEYNICYLCGRYGEHLDVHHVFGGSCRQTSDRLHIVVRLCRKCHDHIHGKNGAENMENLHRIGQQAYEAKLGNRTAFIKNFIRSYL